MSQGSWALLNAVTLIAAAVMGIAAKHSLGIESVIVSTVVALLAGSFFILFWDEGPVSPPTDRWRKA